MLRRACRVIAACGIAWGSAGAPPVAAQAPALEVRRVDCSKGVRVAARDVPVSLVLAELSKQLGFQLKFQGDTDRRITTELTRPPAQLVAKLLESENVVYDEVPDPKCPGRQTLAKVWVLPKGEEAPPRPRELTPMELYRKAHGLPLEDPADNDKPAEPGR